ncbi:heme-binding beta-barrel domain-containing protein, partial [Escherichia coli]|nr:heme-binding beta-barrel domain-containing protein [Escherichia coli]
AEDGTVAGPDVREAGFWRPRGEDEVELLVAHPEGLVEIYVGTARSTTSWELASDVLARTPDHPDVTRAARLYGIV